MPKSSAAGKKTGKAAKTQKNHPKAGKGDRPEPSDQYLQSGQGKGNVVSITSADIYETIFNALDTDGSGAVTKLEIFELLENSGIRKNDLRIAGLVEALDDYPRNVPIDRKNFRKIAHSCISLLERVVKGNLVIPDFRAFCDVLQEIFEDSRANKKGKVADYIPQLSRVDPEHYAMTLCTIDGQVFNTGDYEVPYCIQSTCKPLVYCTALELHGEEKVHSHVGREPSGRSFNEITLNPRNLPHNPMINAGAIMCCSLIKPEESLADRFDYVTGVLSKLTGGQRVGFSNAVYHSEKQTADRNFALAHFMREVGAFPENTSIHETLDFYFQWCSIELTTTKQAMMAAALANAGVCPMTNAKIFKSGNVKHCLSMMYSCGMYDFSGEYAFSVGLPAKSGVSGALMVVIPNVGGMAIWSPRLDEMGNSVRGVQFSREMVRRFNFHNYDSLVKVDNKIDPRRARDEIVRHATINLIWAASQGDLAEILRLASYGTDLNQGDYDLRTAMHLAAAEGHLDALEYLISKGCDVNPRDRWGATPYADAVKHGHEDVVSFLKARGGVE